MKLHERMDVLIAKSKALALQNKQFITSIEGLEKEIKEIKTSLAAEIQKNSELENKIKIVKLAQNIGSPGSESADITELKRKINEYIKEIDHCITMLND